MLIIEQKILIETIGEIGINVVFRCIKGKSVICSGALEPHNQLQKVSLLQQRRDCGDLCLPMGRVGLKICRK